VSSIEALADVGVTPPENEEFSMAREGESPLTLRARPWEG
jgi:hypothetical protein